MLTVMVNTVSMTAWRVGIMESRTGWFPVTA